MIFPNEVTEEQFNRIRPLTDKLEGLFEEAHMSREEVVAAIGVAIGEQFPDDDPAALGCAILGVDIWARCAFEHGVLVKEEA